MPTPAKHSRVIRCRRRRQHSQTEWHATRCPARLASAGELMGRGGGLLPLLAGIPPIHRIVADDRLAVMLAKSFVDLDIAAPWRLEKGGRRPNIVHQANS